MSIRKGGNQMATRYRTKNNVEKDGITIIILIIVIVVAFIIISAFLPMNVDQYVYLIIAIIIAIYGVPAATNFIINIFKK